MPKPNILILARPSDLRLAIQAFPSTHYEHLHLTCSKIVAARLLKDHTASIGLLIVTLLKPSSDFIPSPQTDPVFDCRIKGLSTTGLAITLGKSVVLVDVQNIMVDDTVSSIVRSVIHELEIVGSTTCGRILCLSDSPYVVSGVPDWQKVIDLTTELL